MTSLLQQTLDMFIQQQDIENESYCVSFDELKKVIIRKKELLDTYFISHQPNETSNPQNETKQKGQQNLNIFVKPKILNDCLFPYIGEWWYKQLGWEIPQSSIVEYADDYPKYQIVKKKKKTTKKKSSKKKSTKK